MELTVDRLVRDEGTVVVFSGLDSKGLRHDFAVDHHCAQDIVDAFDGEDAIVVEVEPWQMLVAR